MPAFRPALAPALPRLRRLALVGLAASAATLCAAQDPQPAAAPAPPPSAAAPAPEALPGHDAALAAKFGADDFGMRRFVLVILKNGPTPLPPGPERDAMYRGHFANMKRLSDAGQLVLAGPLDGAEGRRGIFVFAVADVEQAKALAATDPVLVRGEMVAEYHRFYGSAALVGIREVHERVAKKRM